MLPTKRSLISSFVSSDTILFVLHEFYLRLGYNCWLSVKHCQKKMSGNRPIFLNLKFKFEPIKFKFWIQLQLETMLSIVKTIIKSTLIDGNKSKSCSAMKNLHCLHLKSNANKRTSQESQLEKYTNAQHTTSLWTSLSFTLQYPYYVGINKISSGSNSAAL